MGYEHICKFPYVPRDGEKYECLECMTLWEWINEDETWESLGEIESE